MSLSLLKTYYTINLNYCQWYQRKGSNLLKAANLAERAYKTPRTSKSRWHVIRVKYCMRPYSQQPTVEVLYRLFSHDPYAPAKSWVLPAEFVRDPVFQAPPTKFVEDARPAEEPFVLAGAEYNTIR